MKGPKENSESVDSASAKKTLFKRLERQIDEVALGQKDPTPKIGDAVSPFTARVLEYPLPDRLPSIPN